MTTAIARTTSSSLFRQLALVLTGSLFIAACAQIAVPRVSVPLTMQTFAVLLIGAALGARLGTAAVLLYLFQGAVGLPVFSGFLGGPVVFAGPTAGYLLGFIPAVWFVGAMSDRGLVSRPAAAFVPMALATVLILVIGGMWLSIFFGLDPWTYGVAPFIPGGVLKTILAALLASQAMEIVRRFRM